MYTVKVYDYSSTGERTDTVIQKDGVDIQTIEDSNEVVTLLNEYERLVVVRQMLQHVLGKACGGYTAAVYSHQTSCPDCRAQLSDSERLSDKYHWLVWEMDQIKSLDTEAARKYIFGYVIDQTYFDDAPKPGGNDVSQDSPTG